MTHTDQPKSGYPGFSEPEPARRWMWLIGSREDDGRYPRTLIKPDGAVALYTYTPDPEVLAALNETESLRARVTELEALLTRDGHETGCNERYPARECFCHSLSGRGETDGGDA